MTSSLALERAPVTSRSTTFITPSKMMFSNLATVVAIAWTSAAHAAASCAQPAGTQFQIYANTTNTYGQLGGPCKSSNCGVFFSVSQADATTYYSLASAGTLQIAADSAAGANVVGHIAYSRLADRSTHVLFGTKKFVATYTAHRAIRCTVKDSPSGDGTCDLHCIAKLRHGVLTTGDNFIYPGNSNQWGLVDTGDEAVTVKVVFAD